VKKLVNPASTRRVPGIIFMFQLRIELFQSGLQTFIRPSPDQCKLSLELKCD